MLIDHFALFNANDGKLLFAIEPLEVFRFEKGRNTVEDFQTFIDKHQGKYIVSNLSYDLKEELENSTFHSIQNTAGDHIKHADPMNFPAILAWTAKRVVLYDNERCNYLYGSPDEAINQWIVEQVANMQTSRYQAPQIQFQARTSKENYLRKIAKLKQEIQYGNTYEANYCQEYYAENVAPFDGMAFYGKLNSITQTPFSCYLRQGEFEVFCASPERYIQKIGSKLISQPIKGTAPRSADPIIDRQLKLDLASTSKEKAENVMIVDLVRNDLSRIAKKSSVQVEELCGVYSFKTVHHMISTVSCQVEDTCSLTDVLRATFPMGSMTGAPKIKTMQITDELEDFKRGLYSGSIGLIYPDGNYDLNVVIRTFVYNRDNGYLSCGVGGAITIQAEAEKEYEECQVKVKKIIQLFGEQAF